MTAAPSIAFAFASTAEAAGVHGAAVSEPGTGEFHGELGMAGALPTALIAGSLGVARGFDVGAFADTHAGLAVAVGATGRWARDGWGVGLAVDESFYTVESLGGIESLRSPFGNRLAATPQLLAARTTRAGVDVGWTVGLDVGLLRRTGEGRDLEPALDDAWGEIAATWPLRRGGFFLRFRAIVPVASEFHVLGYLPWVAVGRSWGVP